MTFSPPVELLCVFVVPYRVSGGRGIYFAVVKTDVRLHVHLINFVFIQRVNAQDICNL